MNRKLMNRIFGFISFLVAMVTYTMTVQPSVPFWDCGEFSAASVWQQVPHPPGAPLFLMFGKLFQIIIPFGDIGWRINMMSVVVSALSILLLYLITVKVILNFKNKEELGDSDYIAIYGSALVGALAFTFSDTFWFNAVESEVYAFSQLFVSLIMYLMMLWNEKADEKGNEKYLMIIAYLIGLSTGVHLLAILTIFSIVWVVYFRKYTFSIGSFIKMGVLAVVLFFIVYPGIVKWIPALLGGHFPIKNELRQYLYTSNVFVVLTILGIICVGFLHYWGHKKQKDILKLTTMAFLLMLFGYTTYTQILIRSNSNPPMNENEPKNFTSLTSYLGREQYGDQRMWPRRTDFQDETKMQIYNSRDEKGEYIYGEWYPPTTKPVRGTDGVEYAYPDFSDVNTAGELAYMFKYQINHMYVRYFMWNFVGRSSDVRDASFAFIDKTDAELLNYKSSYASEYPVRFFAIPLLFGLLGMFFHFWRDPKMAFAWMIGFLLMGILATLQQNQQDPQPRERDYFYTGSFFVFAMWIGMGAYALIDYLGKKKLSTGLAGGVVLVSLLLVPVNMAIGGWKTHSRAGNYLAFDYSYNLLQSVEQDAILFTNGDNDTFPVWWLQDVVGVRRDVRIVNLSLGQTQWYIHQLKHREPWGAHKIAMSIPDHQLLVPEDSQEAIRPSRGPAQRIVIPVSKDILRQYTDNEAYIAGGRMEYDYVGEPMGAGEGEEQSYYFTVYNELVKSIVVENQFKRPVYFSSTAGNVYAGLSRFLRSEGMAMRVCPVPQELMKEGRADSKINDACLLTGVDNTDNFSLTPKYGFKFRNLSNPSVYYDEVHREMISSYRMFYFNYALYTLDTKKDKAKAIKILNAMNTNISLEQFPLSFEEELQLGLIYERAGDMASAKKFAKLSIESCEYIHKNPKLRTAQRRSRIPKMMEEVLGFRGTYKTLAEGYRMIGEYDKAKAVVRELLKEVEAAFNNPETAQYKHYLDQNIVDLAGQIYFIDDTRIKQLIKQGKKDEARKLAMQLSEQYGKSREELDQHLAAMFEQRAMNIDGTLVANANDTTKQDTAQASAE